MYANEVIRLFLEAILVNAFFTIYLAIKCGIVHMVKMTDRIFEGYYSNIYLLIKSEDTIEIL